MANGIYVDEMAKLEEWMTKGFTGFLGVKVLYVEHGKSVCELEMKPEYLNPIGSVHGGILFTMADIAGGFCARSVYPYNITTMNASINYLNPAINVEKIIGTATAIKAGKRTTIIEIVITNEKDVVLCKGMTTYFNLDENLKAR